MSLIGRPNPADEVPKLRCSRPAGGVSQLYEVTLGGIFPCEEHYLRHSGRFYCVSFDSHGKRSLDCFNRNDKRLVSIARKKDAFHPIKGSTSDSHSLTNFQEGMSGPRKLCVNQTPNRVDLRIRNRSTIPQGTDQPKYSIYA